MNTLLWIAQGLLATIMVAAGGPKLFLPPARLAQKMSWTKDAPAPLVKLLGLVELLGAGGLLLPRLTGIAPILTPLAAVGLSAILLGALATKLRRHESPVLPLAAMLLSLFIAVGRMHTGVPHADGPRWRAFESYSTDGRAGRVRLSGRPSVPSPYRRAWTVTVQRFVHHGRVALHTDARARAPILDDVAAGGDLARTARRGDVQCEQPDSPFFPLSLSGLPCRASWPPVAWTDLTGPMARTCTRARRPRTAVTASPILARSATMAT